MTIHGSRYLYSCKYNVVILGHVNMSHEFTQFPSPQTNKQTNKHTYKQLTNWLTNIQTLKLQAYKFKLNSLKYKSTKLQTQMIKISKFTI